MVICLSILSFWKWSKLLYFYFDIMYVSTLNIRNPPWDVKCDQIVMSRNNNGVLRQFASMMTNSILCPSILFSRNIRLRSLIWGVYIFAICIDFEIDITSNFWKWFFPCNKTMVHYFWALDSKYLKACGYFNIVK